MCVFVCICVFMYYLCTNVRGYVCVCVCVCVYVCMYVCITIDKMNHRKYRSSWRHVSRHQCYLSDRCMHCIIVQWTQFGLRSVPAAVSSRHSWYGDTRKTKLYTVHARQTRKVFRFSYWELWPPNLKILCVCSRCDNEDGNIIDIAVCSVWSCARIELITVPAVCCACPSCLCTWY